MNKAIPAINKPQPVITAVGYKLTSLLGIKVLVATPTADNIPKSKAPGLKVRVCKFPCVAKQENP